MSRNQGYSAYRRLRDELGRGRVYPYEPLRREFLSIATRPARPLDPVARENYDKAMRQFWSFSYWDWFEENTQLFDLIPRSVFGRSRDGSR